MEINKINLNGLEYEIGLEKYLTFIKPITIISQNHQLTLTVAELGKWYQSDKPDYSYFTFTSSNKKLLLYTSRGNSCPQNKVYVLDCVREGFSMENFRDYNEMYGVKVSDTDTITIYYGD